MQETDAGLIPGSGRSPGGGHGNPLQYPCLENPMGREEPGRLWLQSIGLQSRTRPSRHAHHLLRGNEGLCSLHPPHTCSVCMTSSLFKTLRKQRPKEINQIQGTQPGCGDVGIQAWDLDPTWHSGRIGPCVSH